MSDMLKLKPAEGRSVPMENGAPWPVDKDDKPVVADVPNTLFYRRRINDGDLIDQRAGTDTKTASKQSSKGDA